MQTSQYHKLRPTTSRASTSPQTPACQLHQALRGWMIKTYVRGFAVWCAMFCFLGLVLITASRCANPVSKRTGTGHVDLQSYIMMREYVYQVLVQFRHWKRIDYPRLSHSLPLSQPTWKSSSAIATRINTNLVVLLALVRF